MRWTWLASVALPALGLTAVLVANQGWSSAMIGAVVVVTGAVALLILRRYSTHRIGWLLAAQSCFVCVIAPDGPGSSRLALVLGQVLQGSWVLMLVCPVLIAYLFPDGQALSRRWRGWIMVFLAAYAVFLISAASDRAGFAKAFPGHQPPLTLLGPPLTGILGVASLAFVPASLIGAVISARRRYAQSVGDERLQMQWFTLTALSLPAMMGILWTAHLAGVDSDAVVYPVLAVGLSAIPVGIGIAILRLRLFDIELVLSRALTYGALTIAVIAVYGLLQVLTEQLFSNRSVGGLCAAGVVAVAVHPAYARLRRRIERWVYGYRSEPHEALRMLADRAELADPLHLAESITATVAESLKVDRVWVEQVGSPPLTGSNVVRAPLVHRGVRLGNLAVELSDDRQFSSADAALFGDLVRHAAVLVRADLLTAELRQSRTRLVTAREEERRRLRRDLHDGVGPSLAAIVLKLNAVEQRRTEADRNALLAETRDEARAAIAEVRCLVDDLRPPAIDEVGLLGAIRQRVLSLSGHLMIEVVGPDMLPQLPAAVEVAAFRIASEAVTNVARHSGASRCRVAVELDGTFALTVSDNGCGADKNTGGGGRLDVDAPARGGARWQLHDLQSSRGRPCRTGRASLGRAFGGSGCGARDMIRVLIADDHPAYRRGLWLMLSGVDDLEITGEAETGLRAVAFAEETQPDVVLMDLRMPDLDGIEATRRLTRHEGAPAVIVLTMFEDDDSVFAAMRAGAHGYLLKGAEQDEIVRAIRAAAAGEAIFGREIAQRVIAHFATGGGSITAAFPSLTEREREVLELLAAGKGNANIAHELMISLKTVRNHVSNIFTKLQVTDRAAAIVKARRAGLARED